MKGIIWFVIFYVAVILGACHTIEYVPVETVRTEYIKSDTTGISENLRRLFESMYRKEVSTDSLIDRSKETVIIKENGDTARHDKERIIYVSSHREKELEHRVAQQDSIIDVLRLQLSSVKSDSIPVPYPVERQLSKWERTKMDFGGMAIGGVAIIICVAVFWLAKYFRR